MFLLAIEKHSVVQLCVKYISILQCSRLTRMCKLIDLDIPLVNCS